MGMWYDKYIRSEMTPTSQQECRGILDRFTDNTNATLKNTQGGCGDSHI